MDRFRRAWKAFGRGFVAWGGTDGPYGAPPYPLMPDEWEAICREAERPRLTLWVREEPPAGMARAA